MADCSIIWTYQYWNSTTPKNYSIVCKYQVTHACHYVGLALVGSVPPWRSSHQSHPYHTSTQRPTVYALGIERQVDEDAQPWQMTHKCHRRRDGWVMELWDKCLHRSTKNTKNDLPQMSMRVDTYWQNPSQCPKQVGSTCASNLHGEEVLVKFMTKRNQAAGQDGRENNVTSKE